MRVFRYLVPALVVVLAACSSVDNAKVDLIPPEIQVQQVGGPGIAGSQSTGPISVNFKIRVFNPSGEEITLQRLDFSTVASGAYTISGASRPFNAKIEPGRFVELQAWIPAEAEDTIIGSNGPVTLRVNAFFDSAVGKFKKIYTLNINTDLSPLPKKPE